MLTATLFGALELPLDQQNRPAGDIAMPGGRCAARFCGYRLAAIVEIKGGGAFCRN